MESLVFVISIMVVAAVLAAWVYGAERTHSLRVALIATQATLSLLALVSGAALLLLRPEDGGLDPRATGILMLVLSATIGLPLLRPVRLLLSKLMPIDPDSAPDMVGLALLLSAAVYLAASSYLLSDDLEVTAVGPGELIAQAVAMVFVAYMGVGLGVRRSFGEATRRLGLGRLMQRQVWISLGMVIAAFAIAVAAGYVTQLLQPELEAEIQERLTRLTEDIDSPWGALLLGLSAGIGEETLFRGAIQPRFGLVFTSLIFALIHVQYGWSFIVVGVFFVGVLFGLIRQRINTTAAIVTHAAYNFVVVMLTTLPQGG